MRPLYDKLVIRRDETAKTTAEGIHLADNALRPMSTGTIVAAGEGRLCPHIIGYTDPASGEAIRCHVEPLRVKVGDRVLFGSLAGSEIEMPLAGDPTRSEKVLVMSEDEILLVL